MPRVDDDDPLGSPTLLSSAHSPHCVSPAAIIALLLLAIAATDGIRCYTGFRIIRGQSFGGGETECTDDNEYCYNVTADGGALLNAAKAGCSYYRCLVSRNKCIATEISGVPVSFCCCNTEDLCNGQ